MICERPAEIKLFGIQDSIIGVTPGFFPTFQGDNSHTLHVFSLFLLRARPLQGNPFCAKIIHTIFYYFHFKMNLHYLVFFLKFTNSTHRPLETLYGIIRPPLANDSFFS